MAQPLKKYSNPIRRGFYPDPSIIRVGEDYYMVNSTFQYFPAIPISHSKDLIHWETIGHAVTDPSWLDLSELEDSRGIWAPDISYYNGTFYIFATLRLNDWEKPARKQMMVKSDRPEGPYSKPVYLEADAIDPSHFVDDDGTHYMITAKAATGYRLNDECTKVVEGPRVIWGGTGERCAEGPHILKRGGWYYAIVAEGGTGYGHGINIARSRELFGEYEPCPYNPVMRQTDPAAFLQRCGHGKLVETQNGDWWCVYLCSRRNGGNYTTLGRETALDPVTWTDDGWFLINGGNGPSLEQTAPALEEFSASETDKSNILKGLGGEIGPDWQFVRNPDYGRISLDERPGWLRIYPAKGELYKIEAKNILTHREPELKYSASIKMEFEPADENCHAGLTCYYSTATYIRFSVCMENGEKCLKVVANRGSGEENAGEPVRIPKGEIYLRVDVDGQTRRFSYGFGGDEWKTAAILEDCRFLSDEGVPNDRKRHTGTMTGVYAVCNSEVCEGMYADFTTTRQHRG